MALTPQIISVNIEDEMRTSFIDYAMSVIISRAIPDARDGLKPVHRRILYTMDQLNLRPNRPYLKCARVVGDCLGKFHPHGDQSVYDALARMAQDFAMRYPLVDGQGNFGSVDGDPPAAMRYTECRLAKIAEPMLEDIDKDTVKFVPNYDDKELEPSVLPARVPNLLVNGSAGIAVGMATNIPPHNLREVVNGALHVLKHPMCTVRDLLAHVPGPDFPTGGFIYGRSGIYQAFETGRGSVVMRARADIEEVKGSGGKRHAIIVHEIPYQVNKVTLIKKIADLVRDKELEGISDLRDESDRHGMRIYIELKKDAIGEVVLNNLYKLTPMQSSFGVNLLAIVDGRPRTLNLKEALDVFLRHRRDVVTRRSAFELKQAEDRRHIVEGLWLAIDDIDKVIALIRAAADPAAAKASLMATPLRGLGKLLERAGRPEADVAAANAIPQYFLTDVQAQAILDMRLQRLTGLEREKLEEEFRELWATIDRLKKVLSDEHELVRVIEAELLEVRDKFGDDRRTQIVDDEGDISIEDMIADEPMVVTLTHGGYIKRNPVTEYRAQGRGGRGITGHGTKDEDFVSRLFVASAHSYLLIFTDKARVFQKRVYEVPVGARAARGKALVNLLPLEENERVAGVLPVKEFPPEPEEGPEEAEKGDKAEKSEKAKGDQYYVVMATRRGVIKKTDLGEYAKIRSTGIIGAILDEGDGIIGIGLTDGDSDIFIGTAGGMSIRFHEDQVRGMGRATRGVKSIDLREGDEVVGMEVLSREAQGTASLLTVCENGYGKRTALEEYRGQNRGGLGLITIKTTDRNGKVVGVRAMTDEDHLMLVTDCARIIRTPVRDISVIGRNTQGVRLIRVEDGERVVAVECLAEPDESPENGGTGGEPKNGAPADAGELAREVATAATEGGGDDQN
jgi:DNA gyrase subunit A